MSENTELSPEQSRARWQGHRTAALVLRAVVFLGPVTVAALFGLLVSRSVTGGGAEVIVLRVILTAVASVVAFVAVERLGRRFLPLAALLRLNLVFPDRAPSRFSVALRSTSVRKLQQWVREARQTDDATVLAEKVVTLASALNTHDRRTRGHCERTRALADLIVEELHLSPAAANEVRWGAFLHDIGKLVVPVEILNKPGKPTTREWEVLRRHPEAGARLVEPLRPFLNSGVDAVGGHHENFDGTGYPSGLAGEQLPLATRIVSVADAFEVMTAVRAYKRPMSLQEARAELARRSGTQFDPQVVRAFLNVSLGRVHWTLGLAAWIAELPFLSFLPRVAAQVSATAGAPGSVAPIALPGVAAASLGAMAVMAQVGAPAVSPPAAMARTSAPSSGTTATTHPVPAPPAPGATDGSSSSGQVASPIGASLTGASSPIVDHTVADATAVAISGAVDAVGRTIATTGDAVGRLLPDDTVTVAPTSTVAATTVAPLTTVVPSTVAPTVASTLLTPPSPTPTETP